MDFGNLLSRAWRIVWGNKFMLVLGFLAALGSGNPGNSNSNFSFGRQDLDLGPGMADEITTFFARFGPLILGLICFLFFIAVVLWLLRLTAQGALISSAARIDAGETVTFGDAFSAGIRKLGRMMGINILLYGPFTLLGLLMGAFFLSIAGTAVMNEIVGGSAANFEAIMGSLGILGACIACLLCLMVPLLIVVSAIYPFAQRGAVLQDMGVTASIGHGWAVLKANLADIILLALLFIVIGFVFGIIVIVVLIPFALLAFGPTVLGLITQNSFQVLDALTIAAGTIVLGLIAAAINSLMVAFRSTAVTLAYQQFLNKVE
jgi:hypothetical protein